MDNDKGILEDNSAVKSASSSALRNSLVTNCEKNTKRKGGGENRKRSSSSSDISTSSDSDSSKKRKKAKKSLKKKKSKKNKKRKRNKSEIASASDDDSDEIKRRKKKKSKKKCKSKSSDKDRSVVAKRPKSEDGDDECQFGPAVPDEIVAKSKTMAPLSKEEWEKRQSEIRRVYDEDSGRYRLVKGDGEILEECVSRERHRQINKQATAADGMYFQKRLKEK